MLAWTLAALWEVSAVEGLEGEGGVLYFLPCPLSFNPLPMGMMGRKQQQLNALFLWLRPVD